MNIMKAFIVSATASAVLFLYVMYAQQEHKLKVELESAQFDREFAEFMFPGNSSEFWAKRKKDAEEKENETAKELLERKRKLAEFESAFERAWNETQKK